MSYRLERHLRLEYEKGGIILRMIHPGIFQDFGISVNKCYKVRGAYICETHKDTKIIRRSNATPGQINLQYNIKEHLIKRGFSCVNRLYVSRKNTPYTISRNHIFIMSDWNRGLNVDFCNVEDIYNTIRLLAQLHIAGEGFKTTGYSKGKIKNLGETYSKRLRETRNLKKRIENESHKTEFEVLYLKHVYAYRELQELAMKFVYKENYEDHIQLARDKQTIVHGHYNYHQIKKVDDGMIVSGFERSGYDVQLTDLAYVVRRIMQKNKWDPALLLDILKEYHKIRPLTAREWGIMKGMIIFPDKFAKLCNTYYHSKRRMNYNMFYRKFVKMLAYQELQINCAKEILKW